MAITGMYTGGIQVSGGYYRGKDSNIYDIGGGYARTTDGRVILLAQIAAGIQKNTVLAGIGKAIGPFTFQGTTYSSDDYLAQNPITLSKPISRASDIPNGVEINFDTTKTLVYWDGWAYDTGAFTVNNDIPNGKVKFTYDDLLAGKVYYDGTPKVADNAILVSKLSVKLLNPTTLDFQCVLYKYQNGAAVPAADTPTHGTYLGYGDNSPVFDWLIPIAVTVL